MQVDRQPLFYFVDRVLVSLFFRDIRPLAPGLVSPGAVGHECNFGGKIAKSRDKEIVKVLQIVGAYYGLSLLRRLVAVYSRN